MGQQTGAPVRSCVAGSGSASELWLYDLAKSHVKVVFPRRVVTNFPRPFSRETISAYETGESLSEFERCAVGSFPGELPRGLVECHGIDPNDTARIEVVLRESVARGVKTDGDV